MNKKSAFAYVFILFACCLYFYRLLSFDQVYHSLDLTMFVYPNQYFLGQSLRQGVLPFWNPYTYSGVPFMQGFAAGVFYPFNLIFCLLPFVAAANFFIILHSFLAGAFTFLYLRGLKISRVSAVFAGIVAAGCGSVLAQVEWIQVVSVWVWFPLALYCVEGSFKARRAGAWRMLLGLALGVQALAGQPQVFFYSCLALIVYVICRGWQLRKTVSGLVTLVDALLLAGVMSLIQVQPFWEFIQYTIREQSIAYDLAIQGSVSWQGLRALACPWQFLYGMSHVNLWDVGLYTGLAPLLLAFWFAVRGGSRPRRLYILLGLGALVLALGGYSPVYKFFYEHLVLFRMIRHPAKIIFLFHFCLAVLAGLGLERLRGKKVLVAAILLLTVADLTWYGTRLYDAIPASTFTAPTDMSRFLGPLQRRFFLTPRTQQSKFGLEAAINPQTLRLVAESLYANSSIYQGLYDADGYGPMRLLTLDRVLDAIKSQERPGKTRLLDLLAVRNVLSYWELRDPVYPLKKDGLIKVYQKAPDAPWAWCCAGQVFAQSEEQAFSLIKSQGFDPYAQVVLASESAWAAAFDGGLMGRAGKVSGLEWGMQGAGVQVVMVKPGWLVLSLPYIPGWSVSVDGRQAEPSLRVDYLLQGVPLPAGNHTIQFSYLPLYFKTAAAVSIGLLCLVLVGALLRKPNHKGSRTRDYYPFARNKT